MTSIALTEWEFTNRPAGGRRHCRGLDSTGAPYFDTNGVTPSEEAHLEIDPSDGSFWVVK
jgi:hypothetical protein